MFLLPVQTGDPAEVPDGAPVEGVEGRGDPLTVLLAGALPGVVVQRHCLQAGLEAVLGQTEVQLGQVVVVEGDGHQLGEDLEHGGGQRGELVMVQVEELQGLQARQLGVRDLANLVVAEMEGGEGGQAQECSVTQT